MRHTIAWNSPIQTQITWGGPRSEENSTMYRHTEKIRKGNTVDLEYVFRKGDGTVIPLTAKPLGTMIAKLSGAAAVTQTATFDPDRVTGRMYASFKFDTAGIWNIQFKADDTTGDAPIEGDPAMVEVANNVDDLSEADPHIEE